MRNSWTLLATAGVSAAFISAGSAGSPPELDQGWTSSQRNTWYESTQGSRLIPYAWLGALEMANSTDMFISDAHMAALRFVMRNLAIAPEVRLPRGFAIDATDDTNLSYTKLRWKQGQAGTEQWVGMTCAACHTGTITYKQISMDIDGAPAMADFQTFIEELDGALSATAQDTGKFDRFAKRVLAGDDSPNNRALLQSALVKLSQYEMDIEALNHTDVRYGFGRLDAVGHILNKVAKISAATKPDPNPANAPVSYPFLWNVPQHDRVQWNGVAKNDPLGAAIGPHGLDVGALARNTGEVIGVFGDIVTVPGAGLGGYESSVNVQNLRGLEDELGALRPPRWPKELFDDSNPEAVVQAAASAARGRPLFDQRCKGCHNNNLTRTDLKSPITAKMTPLFPHDTLTSPDNAHPYTPLGTDPWMACNAYTIQSASGNFQGASKLNGSGPMKDYDNLIDMLGIAVKETLLGQKLEVTQAATGEFFGSHPLPKSVRPRRNTFSLLAQSVTDFVRITSEDDRRLAQCRATLDDTVGYKGRPLNGIWATAPYLHNGSVPTLYDLLSPPDKRPKTFYTGTLEFDPKNVGFVTGKADNNPFLFDTSVHGNSNAGHDYGASTFSDQERFDLIEYMKTL